MLYNGERVGSGVPPEVDVAVDPVDGTTLTAKALPDALAVLALSERGTMFDPGPCVYMEKLAVGEDLADVVDFEAPVADNLARIAKAQGQAADRRDGGDPRPSTPPGPRRRGARDRREDQVHARRRRRGRHLGGRRGVVGRPPDRHRRDPRGRDRRMRAQVPRRRALRAPLSARRVRAHGRARAGLRSRPHPGDRRPGVGRRHASSRRPASPTGSCCAACATGPGACSRSRCRCGRARVRCGSSTGAITRRARTSSARPRGSPANSISLTCPSCRPTCW